MSVTASQQSIAFPTPAASSSTPSFSRYDQLLAARSVWLVGVVAVVVGAAVTEAFALITRAAGVPMEAASPGEKEAAEIPIGGFAGGVVFWSVAGIILAVALARWAKRPARPFVVITAALTVLSFVGPAIAPHTATSTQLVLAASHVVAAAVIIPALARRLALHRR